MHMFNPPWEVIAGFATMTIGRDSLVKDLGLATHFENIPASLGPGYLFGWEVDARCQKHSKDCTMI